MTDQVVSIAERMRAGAVAAAAGKLADLIAAQVREDHVLSPQEVRARLTDEMSEERVVAIAVDAATPDEIFWQSAGSATKPMLLVPAGARAKPIARALLPLDGSASSSRAVMGAMASLADVGVDVVLLHVFDPATVPQAWDHPEHADQVWREEFARRHAAPQASRVLWRSGSPGLVIADVAAVEHCDLIVLAWSQSLDPHRAETLRTTVDATDVPVLLIPIQTLDGGPPWEVTKDSAPGRRGSVH